jgi:hypothetical protein
MRGTNFTSVIGPYKGGSHPAPHSILRSPANGISASLRQATAEGGEDGCEASGEADGGIFLLGVLPKGEIRVFSRPF